MLKKLASFVLTSFGSSTYPRGYVSGPSLAVALLADILSILRDFHLLSMTCRPWEGFLHTTQ
jgi:hypothetical protein